MWLKKRRADTGGQISASWVGWYTCEDEPHEQATGRTNTRILFIVRLYLNTVENIRRASNSGRGAGVRQDRSEKISTDVRLAEGGLEGGKNWCTTE